MKYDTKKKELVVSCNSEIIVRLAVRRTLKSCVFTNDCALFNNFFLVIVDVCHCQIREKYSIAFYGSI